MIHVHADPLPAPCVDCGRMIDWPERYVFNTTDGIAHLDSRQGLAQVHLPWITRLRGKLPAMKTDICYGETQRPGDPLRTPVPTLARLRLRAARTPTLLMLAAILSLVGWVESTPLLHGVKCCVMAPKKQSSVKEAALELIRAWGREGGKKGAKARWAHVTPEQRAESARKAAAARWTKVKKER